MRRKILSLEQDQWLRSHVHDMGNEQLTYEFNKTFNRTLLVTQIKAYKRNHHISSGLTGHFPKGHVPVNKGKKLPEHIYKKAEPTMFKKGHLPANTCPIGTEKTLADGYLWVKVDNKPKVPKRMNWRPKHVKIWQDAHGPVPDDHIVIFLDGDRSNFALDNLKAVSKSTNARLNQNHLRYNNKEVTEAGVAVAQLMAKISSARRK